MKHRDSSQRPQSHDQTKAHLIAEERHDPYRAQRKLPDPSACPMCFAVYKGARWQWTSEPLPGAHWAICPACHRTTDDYPAGEMTLTGGFLNRHGPEIIRLARNIEALERAQHPLERIMMVDDNSDRIVIKTTGLHLPRRIGHALERAYHGKLETHYDYAGYFVRMRWHRDE